jgi:hypothetical protein
LAATRLVDVTASVDGAELTAIDSCADAVCTGDPLSFTATVNVAVPFAVGVPEIAPPLDIVSPAGRLPEAIDHVYPGVPPLALNVALYELPLFAAPRLVDVIVSAGGVVLTVIDSCADAVCAGDALSVTVTVKLVVPVFVGVPEITPALESDNPLGRLPLLTVHV